MNKAIPLLELQALTCRFGGLIAVNELSLQVYSGAINSIIGPNGAGKSTVFNLITQIYRPSSGQMIWEAQPLPHMKPYQVARRGIARTFQNIRLFGQALVWENVAIAQNVHHKLNLFHTLFHTPLWRRQENIIREKSHGWLQFVGLESLAQRMANSLSYGQQRRLEIARALALEPKLLLLDEPAAGMNPQETEELKALLERIQGLGVTLLLIEHDMGLVMKISDHITVMNFGKKIAEGLPSEMVKHPAVIEAYLGQTE